ncbi:ribosome maturation factor RimM [Brevibacterium litoralis]|uniref:ribosome maturation factor RimM n=1 Tax=Brevibacterium litoralis TaxID=3138935 RepID=UPI0032EB490B
MAIVVARLGKPHGIRGEVTVEVRTDEPEERFVPGAVFATDPDIGELTLARARVHKDRYLLTFEEVPDRNRAEEIRNTLLTVDEVAEDEDDAWYIEDLVDARVFVGDDEVGTVTDVSIGAAQDLLTVTLTDGREVLVPFVEEIVPEVDVEAGRIVLDPPPGLLDLTEGEA